MTSDNRFYRFLEQRLFQGIIGYTIHPLHILALLILWIGLLVFHGTVFELVGGNYTNGLSAMAASIVLLQQTRATREIRKVQKEHATALQEVRQLLHHVADHLPEKRTGSSGSAGGAGAGGGPAGGSPPGGGPGPA